MTRALVWFRNDLRLSDNETVSRAIAEHTDLLFVYIRQEPTFPEAVSAIAYPHQHAAAFREACLHDLQHQLHQRGAELLCLDGNAQEILPALCDSHQIQHIYTSAEYAHNELKDETCLAQRFSLHRFHTSSLIHPQDLPFALHNLPDVFTSFRKKVEAVFQLSALFDIPQEIRSLPYNGPYSCQSPTVPAGTHPHPIHLSGGRTAALTHLHNYFFVSQGIRTYKETRNGLLGMGYSSKLSPWLATGCLSAREIYAQILQHEQRFGENDSTYWLKFELLWRDYFRFVCMKYGKRLFALSGIRGRKPLVQTDPTRFRQWCYGETGQAFVDANLRELWHTGFISNRGRQNVASFLVHDLHIDWRWGAAWFERLLIDYDVYSNYGNWQYLAGVGNDPREGRKFNLAKQQAMYDTNGNFVAYWKQYPISLTQGQA